YPRLTDLLNELKSPRYHDIRSFIDAKEKEPYGPRDKAQFDASQVGRVLDTIESLGTRNSRLLNLIERSELSTCFRLLNALGNFAPIYEEDSRRLSAMQLSRVQMHNLREIYVEQLRNPRTTEAEKFKLRIAYLVLLREAMYRTTGRFPNSTQIIAL